MFREWVRGCTSFPERTLDNSFLYNADGLELYLNTDKILNEITSNWRKKVCNSYVPTKASDLLNMLGTYILGELNVYQLNIYLYRQQFN